jgi:hypothetical protein
LLAPLIAAGIGAVPVTTYCETSDETLYATDHWHCAKGDTALKPWDYSRMQADREAAARASAHAEEIAAAAEPTYCLTTLSRTAYRSPAKTCAPGEDQVSEDEYNRMRTDAASAMTQAPAPSN